MGSSPYVDMYDQGKKICISYQCGGLQVENLRVQGPAVTSLPGLAGLTRMDNLDIRYAAMRNLTSFQSLSCASAIRLYRGAWQSLQSLAGLDNVQTIPGNRPALGLVIPPDSPGATVAALAPLRLFAACGPGNVSPWPSGLLFYDICRSRVRPQSLLGSNMECMGMLHEAD